ncbi:MAG: antibiotic biosynthesis monooxygenase [Hyphomicrobiales bacterium]
MITRIFRVRVPEDLKEEFETLFQSTSLNAFAGASGFISAQIGRPTLGTANEYVMISVWENIESLKCFTGENWNEAHIPSGMERFVSEYWVHHYSSF